MTKKKCEGIVFGSQAIAFRKKGESTGNISFFEDALKKARAAQNRKTKTDDITSIAIGHEITGKILIYLGNYDEAEEELNKSLKLNLQAKHKKQEASTYNEFARLYETKYHRETQNLEDIKIAENYYCKAINLGKEIEFDFFVDTLEKHKNENIDPLL